MSAPSPLPRDRNPPLPWRTRPFPAAIAHWLRSGGEPVEYGHSRVELPHGLPKRPASSAKVRLDGAVSR